MLTKDLKKVCEVFTSVIKNNPIRPMTDFIQISLSQNNIYFSATDGRTIIKAHFLEEGEDFSKVISLSKLYKLVKLTTVEEVFLKNKKDFVEYKGDGKYKLPIHVDESGNNIKLNTEIEQVEYKEEYKKEDVQRWYTRSKMAIEDIHEDLYAYYFYNSSIVATNSFIIANTFNSNFITNNISPYILEQLSSLQDFSLNYTNNKIYAKSDNFEVCIVNNPPAYPIDSIKPFLKNLDEQEVFVNSFTLNKKDFINAIKRQDVFRNIFNTPCVGIKIEEGKVFIYNKQETTLEEICKADKDIDVNIFIITETILNVLRVVEENIKVFVCKDMLGVQDSEGFYILDHLAEG